MDNDLLVRDYLGRLEAAGAGLTDHRRAELVAEVRAHIDAAVQEAGRSDEVTLRNVLERLGSPEEIVAGEGNEPGAPDGLRPSPAAGTSSGSQWSAMEVSALVLLGLAWPALFLPFGFVLWLALGAVGLVLAWASGLWSRRQKLITTVVVVALYGTVIALTMPARGPVSGPPEPSPIVVPNN